MNISESNGLIQMLNSGLFSVVITVVLAILTIIVSYILYKRSKPVARLRFAMGDAALLSPAPQPYGKDLEVRYQGQPVIQLTNTSLAVINDGTTTVRGNDIVSLDQLRLETQGRGSILQATVERMTRVVTGVSAVGLGQKVALDFDFLDPGDGFRVHVLHSGEPGDLQIYGTIRGLPQGIQQLRRGSVNARIIGLAVLVTMVSTSAGFFAGKLLVTTAAGVFSRAALLTLMIAAFGSMTYYLSTMLARRGYLIRRVHAIIRDDPILAWRYDSWIG